ncbi:RNA polymerase sigma factor [Tenggerimyces flavus]|uniref:RNA polymerase sigma factor n=1 Tax=Tenggerimyces flavus TaxID=1708749 RepID=A0ABV7YE18_9ACTN|nr:sigma-70 family RNA polymerase sigma factor [Tenggerimyces flavus]MBM7787099.1 RNA polymerase sigma factor (sigma-70 family) [Tenggerimyces flavus]
MSAEAPIEDLLRELGPQVLGAVVRRYGDFDAAEDAVQEALLAAVLHWPKDGRPDNPRGWLIQTAVRKLTDHYRSNQARRRREVNEAWREVPQGRTEQRDDALELLFMCCHPSLSPASAVALTLRAVGGLTTAEIANAFLVPETTLAQRVSRAKQRIKSSGTSFGTPDSTEFAARLESVLRVLYLIFNEGYATSIGSALHRTDLSGEAIRLTRNVHALLQDDPEVTGLLALMLLTDARRLARTDEVGRLVPLEEQDRSLWDRAKIAEGVRLTATAMAGGRVGEYQLQAAIAAQHDTAARTEDTDWAQILALYGLLAKLTGNPMVELNRAIATAMANGPQAGLDLLAPVDAQLGAHYRLDAVRGHLYELLGDSDAAVSHYRAAAGRTTNLPERDYLVLRAARLNRGPAPS